MTVLSSHIIQSPVGRLKLVADNTHLLAVLWDTERSHHQALFQTLEQTLNHPVLIKTEKQLYEYFLRQRTLFDVPIKLHGTEFQKTVWHALISIPYGTTDSYKQVAQACGQSKAVRATAAAIARNPICIIIPCHRVIAANGKLTGFSGGLEMKKLLLSVENPVAFMNNRE